MRHHRGLIRANAGQPDRGGRALRGDAHRPAQQFTSRRKAAPRAGALAWWAVKPQTHMRRRLQVAPHDARATPDGGGIAARDSIAPLARQRAHRARAMSNTPALIGQGITGSVRARWLQQRAWSARWWSRSYPAGKRFSVGVGSRGAPLTPSRPCRLAAQLYVFYFLEATPCRRGHGPDAGAGAPAGRPWVTAGAACRAAPRSPVQSCASASPPRCTTHAAIQSMETDEVAQCFMRALDAAENWRANPGDEFSGSAG